MWLTRAEVVGPSDRLRTPRAPRPGEIRTVEGKTVGEHPSVFFFTLGQRARLHIVGVAGAAESPWYVVAKDLDNDVLVVVQGHEHPSS
ncbi:MAG: tRNA methyl transferase PRC-barrel domain-containing protein [Gammaproteobacteria bacterium]